MKFYVPSRARPNFCTPMTLERYGVPKKDIVLVLRPDERRMYEPLSYPVLWLPKKIEGLSATRQWIVDNTRDQIHCQIDDDITGFLIKKRPLDRWGGIITMFEVEFARMVSEFQTALALGEIVAGSTQDRVALARPHGSAHHDYTRIGQVIFLNASYLRRAGYRFDRCQIYADQDMALQIVSNGGVTRVSNVYGHSMRPTYAPGGVQIYRNQKVINASAKKLCDLHPGLVKLRWKQKGKFKVPSRVILWKKAAKIAAGEKDADR